MNPGEAIVAGAVTKVLRVFTPKGYLKPEQEEESWVKDVKISQETIEIKIEVSKENYRAWNGANLDRCTSGLQTIKQILDDILAIE